jgi:pSer/pThr/pTyr-binding forkhead associated (FHA) protein
MRKEREAPFDPSQPALVVTYGNTTRKHRPLDRDLLVLGRAACCDFGLVSPEVAPVHCVIIRAGDGWRIRDCTGRGGTRLNGKAIHEERLSDGDTLQIGTFSFQLNLPRGDAPQVPGPPVEPSQFVNDRADVAKVRRLQRSRERLARRALSMRRQLREQSGLVAATTGAGDLDKKKAELEEQEKKLQALEAELKEHDRDLRDEYKDLERQRKELQKFSADTLGKKQAELERKAEAQLAERRAELEAEAEKAVGQRRADLDKRDQLLREREQKVEKEASSGKIAAIADLKKKQQELDEQLRQVEALNAEVKAQREALRLEGEDVDRLRHLEELDRKQRTREAEDHIAALWQQCEEHRKRVEEAHGPVAVQDEDAKARALDIRKRELDHYAAHLQRTRESLTRQERAPEERDTVKINPNQGETAAAAEVGAGRRQEDSLHQRPAVPDSELSGLRDVLRQREAEIARLTEEARQRDKAKTDSSLSDEFELAAPKDLLALVERLRSEISNRDTHIRGLNTRIEELEEMADPSEKEAYEAELNNYRVELEQDRARLNEEIARLQAFQVQLDQTKQETEMQHSRERVMLAREWAEINRLREQLRREGGNTPQPEPAATATPRDRVTKSKQIKGDASPAGTPQPASSDLMSRLKRVRRMRDEGTPTS